MVVTDRFTVWELAGYCIGCRGKKKRVLTKIEDFGGACVGLFVGLLFNYFVLFWFMEIAVGYTPYFLIIVSLFLDFFILSFFFLKNYWT